MKECKFNCPQCNQSLEAPEDMVGETIKCPACSNIITVAIPTRLRIKAKSTNSDSSKDRCPSQSFVFLPTVAQNQRKVSIFGIVFLALLVPGLLAMAIFGSVMMTRDIKGLMATFHGHSGSSSSSEPLSAVEREAASPLSKCALEEIKTEIHGEWIHLKGKIRNNGTSKVEYVKVKVEWLDGTGKVLDSNYTYAVGGEGLTPGSARSFTISSPDDNRIRSYRERIVIDL